MVKVSPAITSARDFFSAQIRFAMAKQSVSANPNSFEYLVDLLVGHLESEKFFTKDADGKMQDVVVADLYAEYVQTEDTAKKLAVLKRMGDLCLIISGFFAESIHRKITDLDYYFGMGGTAYRELAALQLAKETRNVYSELAEKFRPFSDVLGEVSERSGLQSNTDLLRMYERWLFTGNDRLKSVLSEHGIAVPHKSDTKIKH
jgi:hypothetical protein